MGKGEKTTEQGSSQSQMSPEEKEFYSLQNAKIKGNQANQQLLDNDFQLFQVEHSSIL